MPEPDTERRNAEAAPDSAPQDQVTLGLVVTCYTMDRFQDILHLLESLVAQTCPVDQVIVVVQQSTELFEALNQEVARAGLGGTTLLFVEAATGVSRARNTGLRELTTEIVGFVDDDSVLAADWSAATRRFYREYPAAIGVAGAIMPLWDSPAMEWFPRELYWMLSCTYWSSTAPVPVRNGYGANMSFRREAFSAGRRFSESCGVGAWGTGGWRGVGGEEPELALRVARATGRRVFYVPDIRAWHRVGAYRLRCKNLVRRAYWDGRLKAALARREAGDSGVLQTEYGLLAHMAGAQVRRLGRFLTSPMGALRQGALVTLVVGVVGLGFVEGWLRRDTLVCEADASGAAPEV